MIPIFLPYVFQNDTDYWLISDPGVSVADMWQPDGILLLLSNWSSYSVHSIFLEFKCLIFLISFTVGVEWDGANVFPEQFRMADMGIPQPQTPPSDVANVPHLPANAPSRWSTFGFLCGLQIADVLQSLAAAQQSVFCCGNAILKLLKKGCWCIAAQIQEGIKITRFCRIRVEGAYFV